MSIKDFSHAWDEAAQRALENSQEAELTPDQLASAAGMRVRSGVMAGAWGASHDCSDKCHTGMTYCNC